jgi:hypothetical protein
LADERSVSFWRFSLDDPRLKLSRHIVFNLSRPEQSLMLLAPLAKESAGYELCRDKQGAPAAIFSDTKDADYVKLLAMVTAGKENLDEIKRFDMRGFQPRAEYVREMKRYGVLPTTFQMGENPIDIYATDQAYWQSLWHRPSATPKKGLRKP